MADDAHEQGHYDPTQDPIDFQMIGALTPPKIEPVSPTLLEKAGSDPVQRELIEITHTTTQQIAWLTRVVWDANKHQRYVDSKLAYVLRRLPKLAFADDSLKMQLGEELAKLHTLLDSHDHALANWPKLQREVSKLVESVNGINALLDDPETFMSRLREGYRTLERERREYRSAIWRDRAKWLQILYYALLMVGTLAGWGVALYMVLQGD